MAGRSETLRWWDHSELLHTSGIPSDSPFNSTTTMQAQCLTHAFRIKAKTLGENFRTIPGVSGVVETENIVHSPLELATRVTTHLTQINMTFLFTNDKTD